MTNKATGPSQYEFCIFDVHGPSFHEKQLSPTGLAAADTLRTRIDKYRDTCRDRREGATEGLTDNQIKNLRALGYIK